jgi:glycosyltransferase involved in cell wall biosynthesis
LRKVNARPITRTPSGSLAFSAQRPLRLAYFVSHPIQYQAPLLRRIAREKDIQLKVFFRSGLSLKKYNDPGFGEAVKWDVPLLEGYDHEFLPLLIDSKKLTPLKPLNYGIRRILRTQRFDAVWVHGYSTSSSLQAIMAARSMHIPVLLRSESNLVDRPRSRAKLMIKRLFFNWLRNRVSAVLSIGEANTSYWRHYFGDHFPIFSATYAVNNDFFQMECTRAAENRESFRRSLGLDPGRPVILFASKFQTRKRCVDLVDAYLHLEKSSAGQPAPYLLIVGSGEERAALETRAREAAPGNIRFLGFRNQTELPRFYDLCDVFVLPSVHEPWGLVINEVMNAARPVIVSDQVGCQRNLVQNGVNGFVVKAFDIFGLADAIRNVLDNQDVRQGMGAESLKIIQSYNFDANVSGIRQALQSLVPGFRA